MARINGRLVKFGDFEASQDVTAGDDIISTDDVLVGDDLNFASGGTITNDAGALVINPTTYTSIGTGSPVTATGAGDLYVQGDFECDATANIGSTLNCASNQVFSTNKYTSSDIGAYGGIYWRATAQTVDCVTMVAGTTSNYWIFQQQADIAVDYGHAQQATPTLFIQDTAVGDWLSLTHDDTDGVITTGAGALKLSPAGNINLNADAKTDRWLSQDSNTFFGVSVVSGGNLSHSAGDDGYLNSGFGYNSLAALTTGNQNAALGPNTGGNLTTGKYNVAIGNAALWSAVESDANVCIGQTVARNMANGDGNTFVGSESGVSVATNVLNGNTCLGKRTGYALLTGGDGNILIGWQTGDNITSGAENIIIGYDIAAASVTADYQLNIGGVITGFTSGGGGPLILAPTASYVSVGTGSPGTATGAGDLYVQADFECDGVALAGGFNVDSGGYFYTSGSGTSYGAYMPRNTTQSPDSSLLTTGTVSNAIVITEFQDRTFDFAHAQATNPTLFGHSRNQSTTEWWSLTHDDTNALEGIGSGGHVSNHAAPTEIADEASFALPTSSAGWGTFMAGDSSEIMNITWDSAGTVVILVGSANAVTTDTDAKFCAITGADPVLIKNRLGQAEKITFDYHYTTP